MRTIICCAHAGGQGKTTVSQAIFAAAQARGLDFKLASADFTDETGSSKLGRLFPGEVTEFGTGPSVALSKEVNDINANVKFWDKLGEIFLKGNYIIDMGANVIEQVLIWSEIRKTPMLFSARSAPPVDVVLVCKAEKRAVDDMSDLVQRFARDETLPVNNIIVAMNEQGGSFEGLNLRSKLIEKAGRTNIEFVRVPRCPSELWIPMEQHYVSVLRALEMDEQEITDELGVNMWGVLSGREDLSGWFSKVQKDMRAVNLV